MAKSECDVCFYNTNLDLSLGYNDIAVAFPGPAPVTEYHFAVGPRRHVSSFLELEPEEASSIYTLGRLVALHYSLEYGVEDYNIGADDGIAAGQLGHHAYLSYIDRYIGDVPEERRVGGVRWVVEADGNYLKRK